jgi:hypothetical protein
MLKTQYSQNKLSSELKFLNKLHPGNRQAKIFIIIIRKSYFVSGIDFEIFRCLCLAVNFQNSLAY